MINKFDLLLFKNNIAQKTSDALKKMKAIEENKIFVADTQKSSYKELLVESKLLNDLLFFDYLGKKYLGESEAYTSLYTVISESIDLFNKLHMEVDIQPRFLSPALNYTSSISENTKIEIYKTYFEESLLKEYSKPLMEGTFFTKYKKASKLILESMVMLEEATNLQKEDMDKMVKYSIFENIIFNTLSDILIPEYNKKQINLFLESQVPEYFTMFEENAQVLVDRLNANINKLTIMIAPEIFNEASGLETIAQKFTKQKLVEENCGLGTVGAVGGAAIITPDDESDAVLDPTPDPFEPIGNEAGIEAPVLEDKSTEDVQDVVITPVMDEMDIGVGMNEDAPEINTSTNDGIITDAPTLEIDVPYTPADKLPEDYTIDPESIIDDLEQQASFNNIEDMKTEPEEYISIPPEMAYTEESTQFDFRQFAGAGAIIRNK